jgi:signal recognition particle subunit SRP54
MSGSMVTYDLSEDKMLLNFSYSPSCQPTLIDGSRKRRIAAGAGLPVQEVSRLLKQHQQLAKTMKQLAKGGGMQKLLGAMRRGGGGGPPQRGRR